MLLTVILLFYFRLLFFFCLRKSSFVNVGNSLVKTAILYTTILAFCSFKLAHSSAILAQWKRHLFYYKNFHSLVVLLTQPLILVWWEIHSFFRKDSHFLHKLILYTVVFLLTSEYFLASFSTWWVNSVYSNLKVHLSFFLHSMIHTHVLITRGYGLGSMGLLWFQLPDLCAMITRFMQQNLHLPYDY